MGNLQYLPSFHYTCLKSALSTSVPSHGLKLRVIMLYFNVLWGLNNWLYKLTRQKRQETKPSLNGLHD